MTLRLKTSITPFLIVGTITGGLLAFLSHSFFPTGSFNQLLVYYTALFYGILFLLAYRSDLSLIRLLCSTLFSSILIALPIVWLSRPIWPFSISAFLLCALSGYAVNAFHINYSQHRFHFSYSTLFDAVWNTVFQLFTALCFTLICNLLLWLCESLFSFIGMNFFHQLFSNNRFETWSSTLFFAIGLYIAIQAQHIIQQCRFILLLMCKYLFPALAVVGVLFIVSAIGTLFFPTSPNTLVSPNNNFLLCFSFFYILFFNGVYQDGTLHNPYPIYLAWINRIFLIVTPVFTVLALYTVYHQKISINNFSYCVDAVLLLLYNLAYAIIHLQKTPELKAIEKINIVLGVAVVVVTLATTNGWM